MTGATLGEAGSAVHHNFPCSSAYGQSQTCMQVKK
jgi:hypothetical protein